MHITADHQFDGSRLMDVKVMGTLGISEENLTALRKLKNVQSVEGGHSVDVIARKQGSDEEHAIKVMGKTDKLNQITIIDGKLPQASGECLVDEWYAQQNDLKKGDVLNLSSGNEDDLKDTLKDTTYKITGIGSSSEYLSRSRGKHWHWNGNVVRLYCGATIRIFLRYLYRSLSDCEGSEAKREPTVMSITKTK